MNVYVVLDPLATRLWKLHIGRATSLSSATTPVCAQRCSLSGVPASTLRPHHRQPCSPPLAAFTTAGRLHCRILSPFL